MNVGINKERQAMKVGEEPPPLVTTATPKSPHKPTVAQAEIKVKGGNRFAVLNDFIDVTMKGLSRAEINTWMLLFRDTKRDGLARTSQADLARRAGTSTRTIERAVHSLEKLGLLTVVHRGGLRQGPSTYRVHSLSADKLPMNRSTQPDAGVGLQPDISRHSLPTPTSGIPDRDQNERSAPAGAAAHRQKASRFGAIGQPRAATFNQPSSHAFGAYS